MRKVAEGASITMDAAAACKVNARSGTKLWVPDTAGAGTVTEP